MPGSTSAAALRRDFRAVSGRVRDAGNGHGLGDLRALDRLSDAQLAGCELIAWQGLPIERVAQRLAIDVAQVRRWFRDPVFIAALNELQRSIAAGQLLPLAMLRVRQLLCDARLTLRDAVHAGRFVAEIAGLYRTGAPEAGIYAPGPLTSGRNIGEMSAAELTRVAAAGQAALARLASETVSENETSPLD